MTVLCVSTHTTGVGVRANDGFSTSGSGREALSPVEDEDKPSSASWPWPRGNAVEDVPFEKHTSKSPEE